MAPQPIRILPRAGNGSSATTPIYIVGFVIAGVILTGAAAWFAVRFMRKRAQRNGEDSRGAAFLNVRGLVREDGEKNGDDAVPNDIAGFQGHMFSRAHLGAQDVVMPSRVLTRQNVTKQEIVDHHRNEGNLPRPFAPFSFALQAGNAPPPPVGKRGSTASVLTVSRNSFLSMYSHNNRFSIASSMSTASQPNKRKVHQLFDPVLPDELVVVPGEKLTVMQSFDDGWCIVGRPSMGNKDEVELGAVPAWCFLKPVKGLRAERPMRIGSLGVTVQIDAPASERDQVMSWSNF